MLLQSAAKGQNSLGQWRSDLWAAELSMYYSNVYGKISFAPLNILASVYWEFIIDYGNHFQVNVVLFMGE